MKKKNKIKYLQSLAELADGLETQIDALVEQAFAITKENDKSGYTFDYIRNSIGSAEELLDNVKRNDKTSTT